MNGTTPDKGWAWMIVLGITIINLSILPMQQSFGLIFEQRFSSIGITATQASLILHLNGTIYCSLGLINGPMMKKFSIRQVALCGCLTVAVGIFATAFSVSFATIILSYCVILGVGQGIIFPATTLAMNTYFRKKRKVAMGLTVTFTALGPIIMPLLIAKLLESYASTGTILILSGIAMHSLIGALLLKPFRSTAESAEEVDSEGKVPLNQPGDQTDSSMSKVGQANYLETEISRSQLLNTKPDENAKSCASNEDVQKIIKQKKTRRKILQKISSNLDLDLLRDKRYLATIFGMAISIMAETNFNAMFPFVLRELSGLDIPAIARIMSIQAVADITGRLCVPLIAQKVGWSVRSLYVVALLGSTLGRTLLTTWANFYVVIAVSLIAGVSKGTKAVFQGLIIPDLVSLEKLPAASGIMMACSGILSIALGPLIGLVHDSTNSYVGALHFTSFLSMSCVFLWLLGGLWTPFSRKTRKSFEQEKKSTESEDSAVVV